MSEMLFKFISYTIRLFDSHKPASRHMQIFNNPVITVAV